MKALLRQCFARYSFGETHIEAGFASRHAVLTRTNSRRRFLSAAVGSIAVLPLHFAAHATDHRTISDDAKQEWLEGQRRYFTDVILIDQNGNEARLFSDILYGHTVLVHAFYGNCKDACPVQFGKLRKLLSLLPPAVLNRVRIASVSVDPEADDVSARAAMAAKFGAQAPVWRVLAGKPENISVALHKFGLSAAVREAHNPSFVIGGVEQARWQKVPGTASTQELAGRIIRWSDAS